MELWRSQRWRVIWMVVALAPTVGAAPLTLNDHIEAQYALERVRECARTWEMYRDVSGLSQADREAVAPGFARLYHEGRSADQSLARGALGRMGLDVPDWSGSTQSDPGEAATPSTPTPAPARWEQSREVIHVGQSSRRARRRAQDHNSDGMEEYEDGDYRAAAREFTNLNTPDDWAAGS